MDTSMITRLKELEADNSRLKKMYADERLKATIAQEAVTKKILSLCKEVIKQEKFLYAKI